MTKVLSSDSRLAYIQNRIRHFASSFLEEDSDIIGVAFFTRNPAGEGIELSGNMGGVDMFTIEPSVWEAIDSFKDLTYLAEDTLEEEFGREIVTASSDKNTLAALEYAANSLALLLKGTTGFSHVDTTKSGLIRVNFHVFDDVYEGPWMHEGFHVVTSYGGNDPTDPDSTRDET